MQRALRNNDLEIDDLKEKMEKLNTDQQFKQDFENYSTKKNDLAYYIIEQLEIHLLSGVRPLPHGLSQHVEHIMPKNPSNAKNKKTEWGHVRNHELFNEYKYRLGNLLILEGDINKKCGNNPFSKKVTEYKKSGLHYPKEVINNYTDWDFEK